MAPEGILLMVRMDARPEIEVDWNRWYDTRHIPDRLQIPGFLSARRFLATSGGPKYLSLYDLSGAEVLQSEAYLQLRDKEYSLPPDSFEMITGKLPNISRGIYRHMKPEEGPYQAPGSKNILVLGHEVAPQKQEEFHSWCGREYLPALKAIPGVVTVCRFAAAEIQLSARAGQVNTHPQYVTLIDLDHEQKIRKEVLDGKTGRPRASWPEGANLALFFLGRRIYPAP